VFISLLKWSEVKVIVKCVCITSSIYGFLFFVLWLTHCFVCLIIFNSDSSTLGFLLGLATLFFVVCVFYCFCKFVCCVLF
jgi:uncharacterized membrane protein YpjA